jgi:hypothetical protein
VDRLTRAARRGEGLIVLNISRATRLAHVHPHRKRYWMPETTAFVYEAAIGARKGYVRRPHYPEETYHQ